MSTAADGIRRTPSQQLRALGHDGGRGPVEDSPRWHLHTAEEEMDAGRWDTARAALQRARESIAEGSPEVDEAAFVALRLAVSTVDLRSAAAEILALAGRMDPSDAVGSARVRRIVQGGPNALSASMRERLFSTLPGGSGAVEGSGPGDVEIPFVPLPADGLPLLPGEGEPWGEPGGEGPRAEVGSEPPRPELRPIPTESPFEAARRTPLWLEGLAPLEDPGLGPAGFSGRVVVREGEVDLSDTGSLCDRLVEEMLATVTDDEALLLFETATTLVRNGQFESAELMFSAAMQAPPLRLAACEGLIEALARSGRLADAVATASRATRVFAKEGDDLLGIVYWHGVAAQAQGDAGAARMCFARIASSPHRDHFPDLAERMAATR